MLSQSIMMDDMVSIIMDSLPESELVCEPYTASQWKEKQKHRVLIHYNDKWMDPKKQPEQFYINRLDLDMQGMNTSRNYKQFKYFQKRFMYIKWWYTHYYGASNNIDQSQYQQNQTNPPESSKIVHINSKINQNPVNMKCIHSSSVKVRNDVVKLKEIQPYQPYLNDSVLRDRKLNNNVHPNYKKVHKDYQSYPYKTSSPKNSKHCNTEIMDNNQQFDEKLKRIKDKILKNGRKKKKNISKKKHRIAVPLHLDTLTII